MSDRQRLVLPVNRLFEDRLPEEKVQRYWRGIERARAKRGPSPALARGLAIAAVVLSALALWALSPSPAGALRLADGRDVPPSLSARAPVQVSFDDGSHLELGESARVDVLESTARVFGLALRKGVSEFEVHPGGPRAWRIECDGVTVEVVGTHFVLQRSPTTLRVKVTRGSVIVRGGHVPDGVVRLGAGQSIAVPLTDAITPGAAGSNDPPKTRVDPSTRGALSAEPPANSNTASLPVGERPGKPFAGALATPEPTASSTAASAISGPTMSALDASLMDADAARREGRFRDAAGLLERALAQSPGDPKAPLAEFSLGRLYLDTLSDAGRAATHFSRALSGHLPAGLAEDARARLVEAYARGGNAALATDAASEYRALYPTGRRLADVDRWAPAAHPR